MNNYKFYYKREIAPQAIHFLLSHFERPVHVEYILRLIYDADKVCLFDAGYTVVGGDYVCISTGIITKQLYDDLNKCKNTHNLFGGFVEIDNKNVLRNLNNCDYGELSKHTEELLLKTYVFREHIDDKKGNEFIRYPEWQNPQNKQFLPVDNFKLMKSFGYSDEEVEEFFSEESSNYYLNERLNEYIC